jgi:polysaccharide export outer membrane protein
MDVRPTHCRWRATFLAAAIAVSGGCVHEKGGLVTPPPEGAVPTELNPVILPRYVISPPDVLYIQVLQPPYNHFLPTREQAEDAYKDALKAQLGAGKKPTGAETPPGAGKKDAGAELTNTDVGPVVTLLPPVDTRAYFSSALTPAPIDGEHIVQMDGSVDLGIYGSVIVAGLTPDQARERVREFILKVTNRQPNTIQVRVTVLRFNSKQYYVITDGAGYGEQVSAFPITGSETVLDAMARINGLPQVASKREMWVARRSCEGGPVQILPVCWEDIAERGITRTNYQLLPGDRVYVRAQRIITFDNALAKFLQPVERLLGVTLLGSETVNSIKNRNGTSGGG